jgi:hypothetical protein
MFKILSPAANVLIYGINVYVFSYNDVHKALPNFILSGCF